MILLGYFLFLNNNQPDCENNQIVTPSIEWLFWKRVTLCIHTRNEQTTKMHSDLDLQLTLLSIQLDERASVYPFLTAQVACSIIWPKSLDQTPHLLGLVKRIDNICLLDWIWLACLCFYLDFRDIIFLWTSNWKSSWNYSKVSCFDYTKENVHQT